MARILFIEPYCGGSHKYFLDGYVRHSGHEIEAAVMTARKWKWRMRGAAVWLAEHLSDFRPDLILASDYLDLATFCALAPPGLSRLPRAVYFHENQLTYPIGAHDRRDYQYGLTNITSCLAADRVFFNSRYHLDSFTGAADELLRAMPDYVLKGVPERIREKAEVMPVGLDTGSIDRELMDAGCVRKDGPLHIVWNHRWEFDKGPQEFFDAMLGLERRGADFRLSVLGQSFRDMPDVFRRMENELSHRLVHFGFVEDRGEYLRVLTGADVVLSTAQHEFFGISVLEAVYAGCVPLLPARLSYPELIPQHMHGDCLYRSGEELAARLEKWTKSPQVVRTMDCRQAAAGYAWEEVAPEFDRRLASLLKQSAP